jgi:hypothetical protein
MCNNPEALAERLLPKQKDVSESIDSSQGLTFINISFAYSQPSDLRNDGCLPDFDRKTGGYLSFSQPVYHPNISGSPTSNHMGTSSLSQAYKKGVFVDMFPNGQITRFYSPFKVSFIYQRISETLSKFLIPHKVHTTLCKVTKQLKI